MNDRQPLLNVSHKLSVDDSTSNGSKKQLFINRHDLINNQRRENKIHLSLFFNSFSDWRRCFNRKDKDHQYTQLDDDTEHSDKDKAVRFYRLVSLFIRNSNHCIYSILL